jgi:hypothetical protein
VLLYLQERGLEVTGIDHSPLTVEVARERGAADVRLMSLAELDFPQSSFDTALFFGNNLGLADTQKGGLRGRSLRCGTDVVRAKNMSPLGATGPLPWCKAIFAPRTD